MDNKNGITQKELEFLRDYKGLTDEKKIEFIQEGREWNREFYNSKCFL